MKGYPTVLSVMTPFPVHAAADTSVIAAQAIMKGHDIRHLPVLRRGRVLGVVTEADLRIALQLTATPEMELAELCAREPLEVELDTPLQVVVRQMAEDGVDAAVILRQGRLAGIITLSDICDVLLRLLPKPFVEPPGPVA